MQQSSNTMPSSPDVDRSDDQFHMIGQWLSRREGACSAGHKADEPHFSIDQAEASCNCQLIGHACDYEL